MFWIFILFNLQKKYYLGLPNIFLYVPFQEYQSRAFQILLLPSFRKLHTNSFPAKIIDNVFPNNHLDSVFFLLKSENYSSIKLIPLQEFFYLVSSMISNFYWYFTDIFPTNFIFECRIAIVPKPFPRWSFSTSEKHYWNYQICNRFWLIYSINVIECSEF